MFRSKPRNPAQRLRTAVEAMPRFAREAMLRGMDENEIIAGAYADPASGGICPMLAAHRNGGRINLASFARSWDRYTGARRARLATEREVRTLRSFLEMSLFAEDSEFESLVEAASSIRSERADLARCGHDSGRAPARTPDERPLRRRARRRDTGERHRGRELRGEWRWSWILPARSYATYRRRIAAAEEAMAERRAEELLGGSRREPDGESREPISR